MDRHLELGTMPIGKLLRKLSIPAIVGLFMNALYNVIDMIFVGQSVGKLGISALAVSSPIMIINFSFGLALAVGAASYISRMLGAKNIEKANEYFSVSYIVVVVTSIVFLILCYIFTDDILRFFGATEKILPLARIYLQIVLIGFMPNALSVISNHTIRAQGHAMYSMFAMTIGVLINLCLDPLLIFGFDMGVSGAAIATVVSYFIGFIVGMYFFYSGKSVLTRLPHQVSFNLKLAWEVFYVGLPTFLRNALSSLCLMIINNVLGRFAGEVGISTYGIIEKLMSFTYMPAFGIVQGMQPIASFNYGSYNYDRICKVIKKSLLWITLILSIVSISIQLFPEFFIRLFVDDPEIFKLGVPALRIVFSIVPFVGLQIISSSLFQAIGEAKPALFISLLRQAILLIPFVLLFSYIFNFKLWGTFIAIPVADAISCVVSSLLLLRTYRELKENIYE